MIFISEPGMWRLITVSRKPIAKKIHRWMFHEVFQRSAKPIRMGITEEKFAPSDPTHLLKLLLNDTHATTILSAAVYAQPNADFADVPDILTIAEWAAGVAWATLADCLHTHTKPNFAMKEG